MENRVLSVSEICRLSQNKYSFSALHINTQSARNKEEEIQCLLSRMDFQFEIVMFTETWYRDATEVIKIPGYTSFFVNRSFKKGGGVMMLVKNGMNCVIVEEFSRATADFEVLTVKNGAKVYSVMYRPPHASVSNFFTFLDSYLSYFNDDASTVILGGDINIDCLQQSTSHDELSRILDANSYINAISLPTRIQPTSSTLLDVFITNISPEHLSSGVISSSVSDHLPIYLLSAQTKPSTASRHPSTKSYRQINSFTLKNFRSHLRVTDWGKVLEVDEPETAYNEFINVFKAAYEQCFPRKLAKRARKARKPWVTGEHLKSMKEKDKLYQIFMKTRALTDLHAFKRFRNQLNKQLREAKQIYLSNLFTPEVLKKPHLMWKRLNTVLHGDPQEQSTLSINSNGEELTNARLANSFNDFFTSLVNSKHDPNCIQYLTAPIQKSAFLCPTTVHEIITSVLSLKNSMCTDVHDFQIRPIKFVIDIIAPILEHVINLMFSVGTFPKQLQMSKVTVIFKGGDINNFSNYRPISIIPVFSKCIEKLIYKRMSSFSTKHSIITPCQFGFRKGCSTEMALLRQKELILQSFEDHLCTLGIFIDYSKAFDSINHDSLFEKLQHYGFRGTFLKLIISYFKHRHQQVTINGFVSEFKPIKAGVPQGSILGPLLFNLYVNDIVNICANTKFIIYADDTSVFITGRDPSNLIEKGNVVLNKIHTWSIANSLNLNAAKTKAVIFRPQNKTLGITNSLKLGTSTIELSRVAKSLGVIFEEHMTWTDQVNATLNKLSKTVGILSKFRYVLPQNIKLLIYKSLFLSNLSYCHLVWGTTTKTNVQKLHKLQKKAIRNIVSAAYDAHTEPIFKALHLFPVHELYHTILNNRYKSAIKNNDTFFTELSALTRAEHVRILRTREVWRLPRPRTNYATQMLKYQLPLLLNISEKHK